MTPDETPPDSGGGPRKAKACSYCGKVKLLTEFSRNKLASDGLQTYCRPCVSEYDREYRDRDPERYMAAAARKRARTHGLPFALTAADIVIPSHCPVLGIELVRGVGAAGPASPSLDKVVPALGYVPGNVQVISHRANVIKRDGTLEELEALADWMRRQVAPASTSRKRAAP